MKKRFLSLIIALAMMVGVFTPLIASAADEETTKSVTLHKLMMTKDELKAWDSDKIQEAGYDGSQNTDQLKALLKEGHSAHEVAGVYFAVKYNSGTNKGKYVTINETDKENPVYGAAESLDATLDKDVKLLAGKTGANGIEFNTKGLSGDFLIEEIHEKSSYTGEAYVDKQGNELVKNTDGTFYKKGDKTKTAVNKDDVITVGTSITGSKAVPVEITLPLVNNGGVVKEAHVYPKNTEEAPKIDKNFKYEQGKAKLAEGYDAADEGAGPEVGAKYENSDKKKSTVTSELGKKIPFEVKTKIPANAKYNKLVWDDQMQKGLVYNKDLAITGIDGLEKGKDYVLYETNRGFRLVFKDSGLTKVQNAAKNGEVELTLTYSAHLDGTVKPDEVKENNVTFDYSNKPGDENDTPDVKPSDKKITVEKTWAADGKTITEADRHVKAVFTLQEKQADGSWKDVAEHESNYNEGFTHTFENLDDTKTYRVVESVSGYEPQYTSNENGKLTIVNKIDNDNPKTLKPTNPKVVNGGKKFVKTNQDGTERLAGAQFIVLDKTGKKYLVAKSSTEEDAANIDVTAKKTALDDAIKAYNNLSAEEQKGTEGTEAKKAIDKAQQEYNDAVKEAAKAYKWENLPEKLEDKKAPEGAVVLTSDSEGKFEITGLEYDSYKLKEITPPSGFAKLNGDIDFTVAKGSYETGNISYDDIKVLKENATDETELTKDTDIQGMKIADAIKKFDVNKDGKLTVKELKQAQQVINKKVTIPQTGGIGTIIFTAIGLAIMASAIIAIKKRQATEAR